MCAQFDPWFQTKNTSEDSRCSLGWCPPPVTYKFAYKTGAHVGSNPHMQCMRTPRGHVIAGKYLCHPLSSTADSTLMLSADSDSVIHVPNLIQIIKDMNSSRHLYFGAHPLHRRVTTLLHRNLCPTSIDSTE